MKLNNSSLQGNVNDSGVLLFHDDFTDVDTTNLSAHTVSPKNLYNKLWVKDNTYDLTIVANKLTSTGLDTTPEKENDHIVDLEVTNVTLESVIQFTVGTGTSLAFLLARYQDSSNHVGIVIQQIGAYAISLELRELTANVHTVLDVKLLDLSYHNAEVKLKLVDTGSELIGYLDDVELLRASYTRLNAETSIGVKTQNDDVTFAYLKAWNT